MLPVQYASTINIGVSDGQLLILLLMLKHSGIANTNINSLLLCWIVRYIKLTSHFNLVPRLRMSGSVPPISHVLSQGSDWTMHGDNFAFACNNAVSSVKFSTPLFVSFATERKSEDVMPVRHGGGRSDGPEGNTGAAITASAQQGCTRYRQRHNSRNLTTLTATVTIWCELGERDQRGYTGLLTEMYLAMFKDAI